MRIQNLGEKGRDAKSPTQAQLLLGKIDPLVLALPSAFSVVRVLLLDKRKDRTETASFV